LYVQQVDSGYEPRARWRPTGASDIRCVGPRSNSAQKMYFRKKRFPVRARASDVALNATAASESAMATEQSGSGTSLMASPTGARRCLSLAEKEIRIRQQLDQGRAPGVGHYCFENSRDGIVDRNGKPLVGRLVRRVWTRVLKDVRGEQERKAAEAAAQEAARLETLTGVTSGKKFPRDLPRTWPPPLADGHGSAERQPSHTLAVKRKTHWHQATGTKEPGARIHSICFCGH